MPSAINKMVTELATQGSVPSGAALYYASGGTDYQTTPSAIVSAGLGGVTATPAAIVISALGIATSTPAAVVTAGLGIAATYTNPATSADANNAYLQSITHQHDFTLVNPNAFADANSYELTDYFTNGVNQPDASAKTTALGWNIVQHATGAGQRFPLGLTCHGYGMGDVFLLTNTAIFRGGIDANGDEGQRGIDQQLSQPTTLSTGTIAASGVKTCFPGAGTTINQIGGVSPSKTAQTVTLASTSGMATGDYLTVDPCPPGGASHDGNSEAAMEVWGPITVINSTQISIPFCVVSHNNSAAVRGATVLTVTGADKSWGQRRFLVNTTQAKWYTAGTAAGSNSNRTITGSGTAFSSTMVGGDSAGYNIGLFNPSSDNTTASPFSSGSPLRPWYPIMQVASSTSLTILHKSQTGLTAYGGTQTSQGAYAIAPGCRIWWYGTPGTPNPSSNQLVLPYNTFNWQAGDTVECTISPDIDFTGDKQATAFYQVGGTYRGSYNANNNGTIPLGYGFQSDGTCVPAHSAGFISQGDAIGLKILSPTVQAISLDANSTNSNIVLGAPGGSGFYGGGTGTGFELFLMPSGWAGFGVAQQGKIWLRNQNVGNSQAEVGVGAGVVLTNEGSNGIPMPYLAYHYLRTSTLDIIVLPGSLNTVGWSWQGQTFTHTVPFFTGTQRFGAIKTITHADSPYSISQFADRTILVDASGGAITVVLPPCTTYYGTAADQPITVKKIDSSANAVTISRTGSDTIEGGTSFSLGAQYKYVAFEGATTTDTSAGAWWIVANN